MTRVGAFALLLAVTGLWGATFPVVKGALAHASVGVFLTLRFFLAFLLLMVANGGATRPRWDWPAIRCGLLLFAGYGLQTLGLASTLPARSAFITSLSVIFVPMLQSLVSGRAPGRRVWLAAVLALLGQWLLLQPETEPLHAGDLLTLGCALAFAGHVLALAQAVERQPPAGVNLVQMGVVAALSFGLAAGLPVHLRWSWRLLSALVVTGVFASAWAFGAMARALRVLSPATAGVILAFEPVAAALFSAAFGFEALTPSGVLGGALVVTGLVLVGKEGAT